MIEWLEQLDRKVVLTINGTHTQALDEFFFALSSKTFWIPLYALILILFQRAYGWKRTLYFFGLVAGTIVVADMTSVILFKEMFQRYRPSHNFLLRDLLHYYSLEDGSRYQGGLYGFISSHATNFAVITTLVGLSAKKAFPNLLYWLIAVTLLVCYSRIYLGVHYLSDILGGLIWGIFLGTIAFYFFGRKLAKNPGR